METLKKDDPHSEGVLLTVVHLCCHVIGEGHGSLLKQFFVVC